MVLNRHSCRWMSEIHLVWTVKVSARMCSFRWTVHTILFIHHIHPQTDNELKWTFEHIFSLAAGVSLFEWKSKFTCDSVTKHIVHLYTHLIYTDDDVPSAPLNKFENICSGDCDTHLHCYCYSLKKKKRTSHCTGYVERNKRTFFMNPPTWMRFSSTMQHIENDIVYLLLTSWYGLLVAYCIYMNIQLHLVCLKYFGISIQAPSTIHPVNTRIGQQNEMKMKQKNEKKNKKKKKKKVGWRGSNFVSSVGRRHIRLTCVQIVHYTIWFVVCVALHALKTEHFLTMNATWLWMVCMWIKCGYHSCQLIVIVTFL